MNWIPRRGASDRKTDASEMPKVTHPDRDPPPWERPDILARNTCENIASQLFSSRKLKRVAHMCVCLS